MFHKDTNYDFWRTSIQPFPFFVSYSYTNHKKID